MPFSWLARGTARVSASFAGVSVVSQAAADPQTLALLWQHDDAVCATMQVKVTCQKTGPHEASLVAERRRQLAQHWQCIVYNQHGEALRQRVLLPVVRLPLGDERRRAILHSL